MQLTFSKQFLFSSFLGLFLLLFVPIFIVKAQSLSISSSTATFSGIQCNVANSGPDCVLSDTTTIQAYDLLDFTPSDGGSLAATLTSVTSPTSITPFGLGAQNGWLIMVLDQLDVDTLGSLPSSSGGSYNDDVSFLESNSIAFATTSCDWDGSGCFGSSTPPIPPTPTSTPSDLVTVVTQIGWGTCLFWFSILMLLFIYKITRNLLFD